MQQFDLRFSFENIQGNALCRNDKISQQNIKMNLLVSFFWVLHNKSVYSIVDAHVTKSNCLEVKRDDISFFFSIHASPKLYTENYMRFFLQIETSNSNQMLCNTNSRQESLIYKTDVV